MGEQRMIPPGLGPVESVPGELRALPQWVGWRLVTRDGKSTKVPMNPVTGGLASSTDRTTWGTFEQAMAGAEAKRWDGVGFVFSDADPYCGIDLDEVIDAQTGEVDPDAAATVDRFATYTELSPSRTGLHLILRGSPPDGAGRKRSDRECYDRGRFFTVTGLTASEHGVGDRQDVLSAWHAETFPVAVERKPLSKGERAALDVTDDELVRKIQGSKQGVKFSRLWAGDTAAYASGSEADLALCSILAFWCQGDADRIDRLFRASDLFRPKWDAQRGGATYGARTVAKALSSMSAEYDPNYQSGGAATVTVGAMAPREPGKKLFRWASELSAPPRADDWIWEGYLPRGATTMLSALWKAGKTTLLSYLLKACGTGGEFLGKPLKASRVLYVSEEGERHWVRRRDALGLTDSVGFYLQPFPARPDQIGWQAFINQIVIDVETHGFDLVVFDTLAKLWPVQDENAAGAVDAALLPLWGVTKAGAGVLLIHHMRKSGGAEYTGSRGSGALSAFPDILIELTRFDGADVKCKKRVLRAKGRYEETPDELVIELVNGEYVHVPDMPSGADAPQVVIGEVPPAGPVAASDGQPLTKEEEVIIRFMSASPKAWLQIDDIRAGLQAAGFKMRDEDVSTNLAGLYFRKQVVLDGKLRSKTTPRVYSLASHSAPGLSGNEIRERDIEERMSE